MYDARWGPECVSANQFIAMLTLFLVVVVVVCNKFNNYQLI